MARRNRAFYAVLCCGGNGKTGARLASFFSKTLQKVAPDVDFNQRQHLDSSNEYAREIGSQLLGYRSRTRL